MEYSEKEYNGYLFDQLALIERIEKAKTMDEMDRIIAQEKKFIERKLYQKLPTTEEITI